LPINSSIACICYRRTRWVPHSCGRGWATEGNRAPEDDVNSDFQSAVFVPYEIRRRNCHPNSAGSRDMRRVVSADLVRTDGNSKLLHVD